MWILGGAILGYPLIGPVWTATAGEGFLHKTLLAMRAAFGSRRSPHIPSAVDSLLSLGRKSKAGSPGYGRYSASNTLVAPFKWVPVEGTADLDCFKEPLAFLTQHRSAAMPSMFAQDAHNVSSSVSVLPLGFNNYVRLELGGVEDDVSERATPGRNLEEV